MSIDVRIGESAAEYVVRPIHGRPVTFVVEVRSVNVSRSSHWYTKRVADRFVVGLKGSEGQGFSAHTSIEAACRSALYRARRYEKAYSVPRGVAA